MIDFPSSPSVGQIFNSGTGPIYVWDGVAWSLNTPAQIFGEETIGTFDMAGLTTKDITGLSVFRRITVQIEGILSNSSQPFIRVSTDNGATFLSGASDYVNGFLTHASTTVSGSTPSNNTAFALTSTNADANLVKCLADLSNFNKAFTQAITADSEYVLTSPRREFPSGYVNSATAKNAIRIGTNAGTFTSGFLTIKGVRG